MCELKRGWGHRCSGCKLRLVPSLSRPRLNLSRYLLFILSFRRRDIGRGFRARADTQPDAGPLLQHHVELLAQDSVISTFRVSAAEHPRAPGPPDSANLDDSSGDSGDGGRSGVVLMDESAT